MRAHRNFLAALALAAACAAGCAEPEPQGSCIYPDWNGGQGCRPTDARECSHLDGDFDEGGNCILWDLFHPPT